MVCRYCGLPTESQLGHTTELECIAALEREVLRLKAALRAMPPAERTKPPATAAEPGLGRA
jgi:hypothetical protein